MEPRTHRAIALLLPVLTALLLAGCRSESDRLIGRWQGAIDLSQVAPGRVQPGAALPLVCTFQKDSGGTLSGSLDSPNQHASGIRIETVTIKDGAVHLQSSRVHSSYDGRLSADGSTISGQWQQNGFSLPLTLQKSP